MIEPTAPIFENTPAQMLDQFLRGELAAAATYEQAITHVQDAQTRTVLEQCRQSHSERIVVLAQELKRRYQIPSATAGVWGVFTKLVERGAALFGDEAIVKALHAGEVNGLDSYEAGVCVLSPSAQERLRPVLLAPQQQTVSKLGELASA